MALYTLQDHFKWLHGISLYKHIIIYLFDLLCFFIFTIINNNALKMFATELWAHLILFANASTLQNYTLEANYKACRDI